ncbi:MAG: recombinase family protein [Oscillospiraceae bacterium]|nr:recombinase family protein [Oscillospiraceae bacterium]
MKRVCAYCRVSTEQDDQLNSLENQKRYFEQYISNNLEWQFCGLYVDEGISGTNVNKRAGFQKMVQDAETQKFDLVLTKEISRFARNTLDSIFYTRKLKSLGIGIVFMNDNINTLEPDAELRLTIMSSIAQEESRKTSDRVRWGQKRQMEKGVVFGKGVYGYHLNNGMLSINEDEAKIVRLIFKLYLDEGMGVYVLCKELENRGIRSPSGDMRWKDASILRMLRNEKYCGTLKQKKEITTDYLSHKRKLNEGEEDFVIIENSHTPIIDKQTFDRVQQELIRRRTKQIEKGRHSNRYVWSGKVECFHCKSKFRRKVNNMNSPYPQTVWQCGEAKKYGSKKINANGQIAGCDCKQIHELILQASFMTALDTVLKNKESVLERLKDVIHGTLSEIGDCAEETREIERDIARINGRKVKLMELFSGEAITRAEFNSVNDQYNKQLETVFKRQAKVNETIDKAGDLKERLANIDTLLYSLFTNAVSEEDFIFSEKVCNETLHKVVVESRDKVSFYLKGCENNEPFFIPLSLTKWGLR